MSACGRLGLNCFQELQRAKAGIHQFQDYLRPWHKQATLWTCFSGPRIILAYSADAFWWGWSWALLCLWRFGTSVAPSGWCRGREEEGVGEFSLAVVRRLTTYLINRVKAGEQHSDKIVIIFFIFLSIVRKIFPSSFFTPVLSNYGFYLSFWLLEKTRAEVCLCLSVG